MFKRVIKTVAACLAGMTALSCSQHKGADMDWNNGKVRIVAHRGFWNCDEAGYARNSVAALRCAQQSGFWGSEFDVNITSDDVLLVFHDSSADGFVIEQNPYSVFKDMKLENGEPIPTIDDYLTQALESPGTVLVYELKCQSCPEAEDRLLDKSVEKLKEYGLFDPGKVVFISFSRHICERIAQEMPQFVNQYLAAGFSPDELYAAGINGVDFHHSVFASNPDWFSQARSNGMSVNCWTVNKEEDMRAMIELGVDCITTDCPDILQELLTED